jgi:paired amphipathic helix protein Sin3a
MHQGYANTTAAHSPTYLNQTWVSVPFGSEDYSFQIMRKNTYEEQLFKTEDEKYEYDLNVQLYRRTINVTQKFSLMLLAPQKIGWNI